MKGRVAIWLLMVLWVPGLLGQSLFEEASQEKASSQPAFDLWGYVRSTLYLGQASDPDSGEIKSGYGEFSLKLKAEKADFGGAFAEIRGRHGQEFDLEVSEFNLREAYVDTYLGRFDLRIGHQIVVWGRADGINPTDNITPKDLLVRSPDEDDRRLANFAVRTHYNLSSLRLEALWVPFYAASRIPTEFINFPPGVLYGGHEYPTARLKNSAFAFRLNLELSGLDGSLSYFNGYNPFPGLSAAVYNVPPAATGPLVQVFLKAYRMHTLGGDFSTTLGKLGLRGEAAYRRPHLDYETNMFVINPDIYYVVGVDREFSNGMSFILQYLSRYVLDFKELDRPSDPSLLPLYNLNTKNRLLASQQYQWSHSFSLRLAASLLHETLHLELMSMVNLTSEEYLLRPKMDYEISDAFSFVLGGELYRGPEETLFNLVEKYLSGVFSELRVSF